MASKAKAYRTCRWNRFLWKLKNIEPDFARPAHKKFLLRGMMRSFTKFHSNLERATLLSFYYSWVLFGCWDLSFDCSVPSRPTPPNSLRSQRESWFFGRCRRTFCSWSWRQVMEQANGWCTDKNVKCVMALSDACRSSQKTQQQQQHSCLWKRLL